MSCHLCGTRKPRRACPALNQSICPVCCGTKLLTEIHCPDDCVYLTSAREHPAAAVKRQQARDVAILMPTIDRLTERQYQLFFLFQTLIARHVPEGFAARLIDDDVAEAAASGASTLETAARGVIYEHSAPTLSAQRLATEMKTMLAEMRQQGAVYDREAAIVLRAIEKDARETRQQEPGDNAYLTLMARLLQRNRTVGPTAGEPSPSLIIP